MLEELTFGKAFAIVAGTAFLLGTSGKVVGLVLRRITPAEPAAQVSPEMLEVGRVIGKCENLLVLILMLLEAQTALAIIFTAKALVRKEDIARNSFFFLAGTMVNVTYSITVAFVLKLILQSLSQNA